MLVSMKWLHDYVDVDMKLDDFVKSMIMSGTEVEGVTVQGEALNLVLAGKITDIKPHENSDHLQICQLDVGDGQELQIVTGAQNVFVGAVVPVAMIGSHLPNGMDIKKGKLRGVESNGMLCSGGELCIDDAVYPGASVDGILILKDDVVPGTPMARVLHQDDVIVEFKTTANRADCLSMVGMAREVGAVLNKPLWMPAISYRETPDTAVGNYLSVKVEETVRCPRYMARVVENVRIGPSPAWMQEKLLAAGVRAINNIVDITNFVMLEMGQPMHAFDYRQVEGREIIVRCARPGEKIVTLDEKERELEPSMLVIANQNRPMAVAGIMGGEHSGIHEDTKTVVFESANFEGTGIRLTSRALGLRTESSSRYEKGVDPTLTEKALDRAMTLITMLDAGDVVTGAVDVCYADLQPRTIRVKIDRVNAVNGITLESAYMKQLLERLQIRTEIEGDELVCIIPTWRNDMEHYADVAEEVLRLHGYDAVPLMPLEGAARGRRTNMQQANHDLKDLLAAMGLNEAQNFTFMSPAVFDKLRIAADDPIRSAIRILNPLGEDYSLIRTTMVPAMLQSLATNAARKTASAIRLFEVSRIFMPVEGNPLPDEIPTLCFGITEKDADFFRAKGMIELLCQRFGVKQVTWIAGGHDYYHPGRKAQAMVGGKLLAELGELHPQVQEAWGLTERTLVAQMDLRLFFSQSDRDVLYAPLPRFPAVIRDLAVTVDDAQPVGPMMDAMRRAGGNLMKDVALFDVYRGPQAGIGKKSVAFSLTYQAEDHTLVDEEIQKAHAKVLRTLEKQFAALIRQ